MCGYGGVSLDPKAYEDASPLALINENYKEGQLNPYPGSLSAFLLAAPVHDHVLVHPHRVLCRNFIALRALGLGCVGCASLSDARGHARAH